MPPFTASDAKAQAMAARAYAKAQRPWHRKKRFVIPGILGILVVVAIATNGGDDGVTPTDPDRPAVAAPVITVDARLFGDEFDANQVAAERKYNGGRVRLTAEITNITEGSLSFGEVTTGISMTQVACRLSDPDQALTFKNGQSATIVGTVSGQSFGVITLRECSIQPRGATTP